MRLEHNPRKEGQAGIYIIENAMTGHFYIGQATHIKRRFIDHRARLRDGSHGNGHLQRSFAKHGESAFSMFMMQPCDPVDLDRIEQEWVDCFWDGGHTCYNIKREATKPPSRRGAKLTPEQLKVWSEVKKGKRFTEEHKRKIGDARRGRKRQPFSAEWKANIVAARAKTWDIKLRSPSGEEFGPIVNMAAFCRKHGLYFHGIQLLVEGRMKQTMGWMLVVDDPSKHPFYSKRSGAAENETLSIGKAA